MNRCSITSCAATILWVAGLAAASPPAARPDLSAFVKELIQTSNSQDQNQMATWYPFEFFVQADLLKGDRTRAASEQDFAFLKPYHIVTVQRKQFHADGSASYATEDELRAAAVLKAVDGVERRPFSKAPPRLAACLAAMRANSTADGGLDSRNTHFLVFLAKSGAQEREFDASEHGKLTLVLKANPQFRQAAFHWHTPFESLHPRAPCAKCRELLSSQWHFCPWCGTRATTANNEVIRMRTQPTDK